MKTNRNFSLWVIKYETKERKIKYETKERKRSTN